MERLYKVVVDYGYGEKHDILNNLDAKSVIDWAIENNKVDLEELEESTDINQFIELHLMDSDYLYYVEYEN
jgi:hypothetical protein